MDVFAFPRRDSRFALIVVVITAYDSQYYYYTHHYNNSRSGIITEFWTETDVGRAPRWPDRVWKRNNIKKINKTQRENNNYDNAERVNRKSLIFPLNIITLFHAYNSTYSILLCILYHAPFLLWCQKTDRICSGQRDGGETAGGDVWDLQGHHAPRVIELIENKTPGDPTSNKISQRKHKLTNNEY